MQGYRCAYHPDREAVTKCEQCGALICLECKSIYRRRYHSSHNHHSYSTRYELCPICYEEKVRKANNPLFLIFPCAFLVVFMGIVSTMFAGFSGSFIGGFGLIFIIVPIIMAGVLLYQFLVKGPQQKREAEEKKNRILQGRSPSSFERSRSSTYASSSLNETRSVTSNSTGKKIYCQQCGHELDPNSSFCSNCGNDTTDELRNQGYR